MAVAVQNPQMQIRRVLERFIETARTRCEYDISRKRRADRRYHRSWPMLITIGRNGQAGDISVALHNASPHGIGFLSPRNLEPGTIIYIKLFWHDESCPPVPAIVRHCTSTIHGYLLGCEFCHEDASLCVQACQLGVVYWEN